MSTVLCKGGMHHVPASAITQVRNGRKICSACVALILARMDGTAAAAPKPEKRRGHPALPNPQYRVMRR